MAGCSYLAGNSINHRLVGMVIYTWTDMIEDDYKQVVEDIARAELERKQHEGDVQYKITIEVEKVNG
jgi:hypothetical protein